MNELGIVSVTAFLGQKKTTNADVVSRVELHKRVDGRKMVSKGDCTYFSKRKSPAGNGG